MESLGYNRAFYNESFFERHLLINHNLIYLANNVIFSQTEYHLLIALKKGDNSCQLLNDSYSLIRVITKEK